MKDAIIGLGRTGSLLAMDADQGETDTLNENVVSMVPISTGYFFPAS